MVFRLEMMVAVLAVLAVATGCVPLSGGWDVDSLGDRHPEAMAQPGQRLGDTPAYFIPRGTSAVLFLCRFSKQSPISPTGRRR